MGPTTIVPFLNQPGSNPTAFRHRGIPVFQVRARRTKFLLRSFSFFLFLFLILLTAASCKNETGAQQKKAADKKTVRVIKAHEGKLPLTIAVSGTLAAEEEVRLSMKVTGRVQEVLVDLGSQVRRGQPLVRLDPADFQLRVRQAQAAYQQARVRLGLSPDGTEGVSGMDLEQTPLVRQARATLQEAQLTLERMKKLFEEGLISRSQMDDAEAAFQIADARYQDAQEEIRTRQAILIQRQAELDLAQQQLSDTILTSSMEGAISERMVSPGQVVTSGDHVLTLVRIHPLRLKLSVPERRAGEIRPGQVVHVRVEGDSGIYTGKIARISPAISMDNRTLMVEAEVPNPKAQLRPGSFARADILLTAEQPAVLVPQKSIIAFAGITKVMSVEKDQVREKRVKLGRRSGEFVEITEGLSAGDPVVIDPGNLYDGEPVHILWE